MTSLVNDTMHMAALLSLPLRGRQKNKTKQQQQQKNPGYGEVTKS